MTLRVAQTAAPACRGRPDGGGWGAICPQREIGSEPAIVATLIDTDLGSTRLRSAPWAS